VSWAWWDWPLTWLTNHRPSVLWHWWLGHVTRETVSEMTYNVSSGTLNTTIPICFASISQVISLEDRFFAPVRWLAGKVVSETSYSISSESEMLKPIKGKGLDTCYSATYVSHAYEKKKNALPLPIVRCWSPLASPFSEEQALVSFGLALCMFVVFIDCCFRFLFCHLVVIVFVLLNPLTSSWPHLRCDVGLEEGEYK